MKIIEQQCDECDSTTLAPIPGHIHIAECTACGHPNDVLTGKHIETDNSDDVEN